MENTHIIIDVETFRNLVSLAHRVPFDKILNDKFQSSLNHADRILLTGANHLEEDRYDFFTDLNQEIKRARAKHPRNTAMIAALTEECGEVARALTDEPTKQVREESVQTACVAFRIYTEGDETMREYREGKGLNED